MKNRISVHLFSLRKNLEYHLKIKQPLQKNKQETQKLLEKPTKTYTPKKNLAHTYPISNQNLFQWEVTRSWYSNQILTTKVSKIEHIWIVSTNLLPGRLAFWSLVIPNAYNNFVVVPIFNPSTYCTPFCGPLCINRFILFCIIEEKNWQLISAFLLKQQMWLWAMGHSQSVVKYRYGCRGQEHLKHKYLDSDPDRNMNTDIRGIQIFRLV